MKGNRFEVGDRVRVVWDYERHDFLNYTDHIKAGEIYTIRQDDGSDDAPYTLKELDLADLKEGYRGGNEHGWFRHSVFELVEEEEGDVWTTP